VQYPNKVRIYIPLLELPSSLNSTPFSCIQSRVVDIKKGQIPQTERDWIMKEDKRFIEVISPVK
jgi:hypothetical protein